MSSNEKLVVDPLSNDQQASIGLNRQTLKRLFVFIAITACLTPQNQLFAALQPIAAKIPERSAAKAATQKFQRIFIIELENSAYSAVLKNSYFANLASRGRLLNNYYAVAHPSQPNYIAQIAGDTFVTDDSSHNLAQSNLVDLLEGAGISWKTYQENYPGNCYSSSSAAGGLYARKHNPFISFDNIRQNATRCAKIVNASQLDSDIAANALPQYSFYVPNQENDGHNTGISYAATWLQGFLEPKLTNANFMNGTLVVVTFDEDNNSENNHIYTVLLGSTISASTDPGPYNHYSQLRMVEDNFAVGTLGRNDASATTITIPGQSTTPTVTPTTPPTVVAPTPTKTATATPLPTPTSVPLATPSSMPTSGAVPIFQDGFEAGTMAAWTSSAGFTVQSAVVHSGGKAAQGNTTVGNTYAKKTLPTTYSDAYTRIYFNLISYSSQVNVLRLRTAADGSLAFMFISTAGKLSLRNDVGAVTVTSATSVASGWHALELHCVFNGTNSTIEVWLDNVKVNDLSITTNLGVTPIGRLQIGEVNTGRTYQVVIDDVVFNTNKIGL